MPMPEKEWGRPALTFSPPWPRDDGAPIELPAGQRQGSEVAGYLTMDVIASAPTAPPNASGQVVKAGSKPD
jgi:hypothetical protein